MLRELRRAEARLVRGYLARLPRRAEELEGALGGEACGGVVANAVTLRRLAHNLAGSAGSYGFPELSRLAKAAEWAAAENLVDCAISLIDEIRQVHEREGREGAG